MKYLKNACTTSFWKSHIFTEKYLMLKEKAGINLSLNVQMYD